MCSVVAHGLPVDAPQKPPEFDAASIKPQPDRAVSPSFGARPSGFRARRQSFLAVIAYAHGFRRDRIIGAPRWLESNEYDIVTRTNQPDVPIEIIKEMLRTMLADRLQLRVHVETRQEPVFALVVARRDGRLGPSLTPSTGCDRNSTSTSAPSPGNRGNRVCGTRTIFDGRLASIESGGRPISDLVRQLQGTGGRAVVDKTGLTGLFDFELRFTPAREPGAAIEPGDVPEVFTAIREQLGLELRSEPGSVEVLVIDQVEPPSPD